MSFKCKFCGKIEPEMYTNFFALCCNEAVYAKGHSAYVEIKEGKKK